MTKSYKHQDAAKTAKNIWFKLEALFLGVSKIMQRFLTIKITGKEKKINAEFALSKRVLVTLNK